MRFDLTCNITLEAEPGQQMRLHVLPATTMQQLLLNEVVWVEGCDHWAAASAGSAGRLLELEGCAREVHVAFAASLNLMPVWRHPVVLRELAGGRGVPLPAAYTVANEHWATDRIITDLADALPTGASVFETLPELFSRIRGAIEAKEVYRYAHMPLHWTLFAQDRVLGPLQFAVAAFRALGVPARMVAGFTSQASRRGPRDARAFYLELYQGGRWWLFESSGEVPSFGLIRTAVGREPGELALVQGAGSAHVLTMDVSVDPPPGWGPPQSTGHVLSLDVESNSHVLLSSECGASASARMEEISTLA